jgi:hypothetical protein
MTTGPRLSPTHCQRCHTQRTREVKQWMTGGRQTIAVMKTLRNFIKNPIERWAGAYRSSRIKNSLYLMMETLVYLRMPSVPCSIRVECWDDQWMINLESMVKAFNVFKSVHRRTFQINQPTRCNNFSSLLLDDLYFRTVHVVIYIYIFYLTFKNRASYI